MTCAPSHREPDRAGRAHPRERPGNIVAVGHQLREVAVLLVSVEEVVDPVRCVSEERLRLDLLPPARGHDSEDKGVDLDILVVVNRTGGKAEAVEQAGGRKQVGEFRMTRSDRRQQLVPSWDSGIQRLSAQEVRRGFGSISSIDVHVISP